MLDLGGSKFKVLQVKVREGTGITRGGVEMEEKTYPIPKELHIGSGAEVRGSVDGNMHRGKGYKQRWGAAKSALKIKPIFNLLLVVSPSRPEAV